MVNNIGNEIKIEILSRPWCDTAHIVGKNTTNVYYYINNNLRTPIEDIIFQIINILRAFDIQ